MIFPKPLRPGERICIIDPANAFQDEALLNVQEYFTARGFEVTVSEDMAFKRGTPEERAGRLNQVIRDEKNRGIVCLWGGYGTMTLLDKIDYGALERNRPAFAGFSDITAMHLAIAKKTELVTYHGPALYSVKRPTTKEAMECFMDMVMEPEKEREFLNIDGTAIKTVEKNAGKTAGGTTGKNVKCGKCAGVCEGTLIGGNMTLVTRLMGTPYEADTKGKILFLEEIGEKPYRLHGMMTQLKLAGKLDAAEGIIIGALTDCDDKGRPGSGLAAVLDVLSETFVPVFYNVRAGHICDPLTLPLNGRIRIEGERIFMV